MEINIEKKHFWILAVFLAVLGIGAVIAYVNPGHSANEVEVTIGGATTTLQQAITDGKIACGVQENCQNIYASQNVYSGGLSDNNKVCTKASPQNCPSGTVDTKCDEAGRCNQLCIGNNCKTSWGNCTMFANSSASAKPNYFQVNIPPVCIGKPCFLYGELLDINSAVAGMVSGIYIQTTAIGGNRAAWSIPGVKGFNGDASATAMLNLGSSQGLYDDSSKTGGETTSTQWTAYDASTTAGFRMFVCDI